MAECAGQQTPLHRAVSDNADIVFSAKVQQFIFNFTIEHTIWRLKRCDRGDFLRTLDLTNAEITARRALLPVMNFYRKYVPGYENAYLAYTGTQIGVRESRRVVGGYWLTADKDIANGLKHDDVIAKSRAGSATDLSFYTPQNAPIFDIPYRCIVPKVINGLLIAGRCISIDHKAATLLSPRDVSTCMVLGQVAGTAAALAVKKKIQARNLDISLLQKVLREQGTNI